ncbi:uncharacterized protein [Amphiura filiformis]|uniref:uncharacterized protein n=1 Tax=Amphiura filiformis TaxID=82378 RepID=UPI003B211508
MAAYTNHVNSTNDEQNYDFEAVCKLQAHIRGILVRKQLNQLRDLYERLAVDLDGHTAPGLDSNQILWKKQNLCKPIFVAQSKKTKKKLDNTPSTCQQCCAKKNPTEQNENTKQDATTLTEIIHSDNESDDNALDLSVKPHQTSSMVNQLQNEHSGKEVISGRVQMETLISSEEPPASPVPKDKDSTDESSAVLLSENCQVIDKTGQSSRISSRNTLPVTSILEQDSTKEVQVAEATEIDHMNSDDESLDSFSSSSKEPVGLLTDDSVNRLVSKRSEVNSDRWCDGQVVAQSLNKRPERISAIEDLSDEEDQNRSDCEPQSSVPDMISIPVTKLTRNDQLISEQSQYQNDAASVSRGMNGNDTGQTSVDNVPKEQSTLKENRSEKDQLNSEPSKYAKDGPHEGTEILPGGLIQQDDKDQRRPELLDGRTEPDCEEVNEADEGAQSDYRENGRHQGTGKMSNETYHERKDSEPYTSTETDREDGRYQGTSEISHETHSERKNSEPYTCTENVHYDGKWNEDSLHKDRNQFVGTFVTSSVDDLRSSMQKRLMSSGMEESCVAADMTSLWSSEHSFEEPTTTITSYPHDIEELQKLRSNVAMELLWVQQAINSRKNYLRLKKNMTGETDYG